jgi:hypothetical protein
MAKVKYYYDSENLAYRKIKIKKRNKFGFVILFLVASALFGSLIFDLIKHSLFWHSKDRLLIREIENWNYAVLNKMNQLDNVIEAIEDRDNNLYRTYFNTSPYQRKNVSLD